MRYLAFAALVVACGDNVPGPPDALGPVSGPYVLLDFTRPTSLFDAPVPADDLVPGDAARLPNPMMSAMFDQARALLGDASGFALAGGVWFQTSEPLVAMELPDLAASAAAGSPVFLVGIDPSSPDLGVRYPVAVDFTPDTSPYGAANLLTLLPLQGVPLRPHTRYAAVVTTALHGSSGGALVPAPTSVLERFGDAIGPLRDLGIANEQIAGLTAFTTGDPTATLSRGRAAALAQPLPSLATPLARTDLFADFCVYTATIAMPDWQSGTPPFASSGGAWQLDADGVPIVQGSEVANLVITLPRAPLPSGGYPLVVFVRAGGGGDRPLVDRGQQAMTGGPALVPGEGPARYLARAGFAALQVDGPLGGARNLTHQDEQFLTFNIANLPATRDNLREAALELDVMAHTALALHVDASTCPPAGTANVGPADVTFDAAHVAVMGHNSGARIAQIAAASEPLFATVILSGAGGSWIDTLLDTQKPIPYNPIVALLLHDMPLRASDPALTIAQWALEPADAQVYAAQIRARDVLMIEGVTDGFTPPPVSDASSLALRLDLAGDELDTELGPLLPLVGRGVVALPATGVATTAVVTQFAGDGIEDGHEVMFQLDAPKHAYQCFLASWLASGVPTVPVAASRDAPCP